VKTDMKLKVEFELNLSKSQLLFCLTTPVCSSVRRMKKIACRDLHYPYPLDMALGLGLFVSGVPYLIIRAVWRSAVLASRESAELPPPPTRKPA
jgi:hypothetical protein